MFFFFFYLFPSHVECRAAECAFNQVNDVDGGTGDTLPDLEDLLGGVACEDVVSDMFL